MAEVALVEAPSKPAGPTVPSPGGEIKVHPPSAKIQSVEPPTPGSAKDSLFRRIHKDGGITLPPQQPKGPQPPPPRTDAQPEAGKRPDPNAPLQPVKPPEKKPDAKPELNPQTEPETKKPEQKPETKKGDKPEEVAELTDEELAAKAADKTQKTNPWKLLQKYKQELKKTKEEHESTRALITDENARKAEVERLEKAEKRAKELEDEIRHVNYSKSAEFKEKYVQPYEHAWETAMNELAGLQVLDEGSGEMRKFSAPDMLELVQMPLAQARALADQKWGDYADDVMAQRKEIRGLFDKQMFALKEAKEKGGEREKQMQAESQKAQAETTKSVQTYFKAHNDRMLSDERVGTYLKPVEGDDELNTRLETGYNMVDKAFTLNPMDPSMTPAQREEAVRMHVAVRNRSAAFGGMRLRLERVTAELAQVKEELAQYKVTTPNLSGKKPDAAAPTEGSFTDRFTQKLASKAR